MPKRSFNGILNVKGSNAMQSLSRSVKLLIATIMALFVGSNLVTGGMANSFTTVPLEPVREQFERKVDERLITANAKFAFSFYEQVLKQRKTQNVFISPTSVMIALAMTYNGADGETKKAMANALAVEGMSLEEVNRAAADLKVALNSVDPKVQLKIANSLWTRNGFSPKAAFMQRVKERYAAEVASLDFASSSAPATINSWVKRNTEGRIEKVVDNIKSDVVLFLINAIYFKGQWQVAFEKDKTKDDVFRLAGGSEKKLPMMVQSGKYNYLKGKDFQAVTLPYGTGRISMYVFLPDENSNLDQFERSLTTENWENWMRSLRLTPGQVTLPRFKIDYEAELNDMLQALGMAEAFDPARANFSELAEVNSSANLYISEVKHKAFAEVNEEGTVAAAVTSVGAALTSLQQPQVPFNMKVDRPFFMAIRDNGTGVLLFMGSVGNPS